MNQTLFDDWYDYITPEIATQRSLIYPVLCASAIVIIIMLLRFYYRRRFAAVSQIKLVEYIAAKEYTISADLAADLIMLVRSYYQKSLPHITSYTEQELLEYLTHNKQTIPGELQEVHEIMHTLLYYKYAGRVECTQLHDIKEKILNTKVFSDV